MLTSLSQDVEYEIEVTCSTKIKKNHKTQGYSYKINFKRSNIKEKNQVNSTNPSPAM